MIRLTFVGMKKDSLLSHQEVSSSQKPHVLQTVDRLAKLPPQAIDIEESVYVRTRCAHHSHRYPQTR
jgi:hypothetical protein